MLGHVTTGVPDVSYPVKNYPRVICASGGGLTRGTTRVLILYRLTTTVRTTVVMRRIQKLKSKPMQVRSSR